MTSSCDIQLTPGQKCLLDLLQRKLLSTVQVYSKLSQEKNNKQQCQQLESNGNQNQTESGPTNNNNNNCLDDLDKKLLMLKERIRRLSARQKRFTYEIISGNGNNTIPKESFFEALGLLTREALVKLNSKTKERRRRTTANPRFSHEAIQARRIVNSKKPVAANGGSNGRSATNNTNHHRNGAAHNNNNGHHQHPHHHQQQQHNHNHQQQTTPTSQRQQQQQQGVAPSPPIPDELRTSRKELLQQCNKLQQEIDTRTGQIKDKRQSIEKMARQNELIRNEMMNIINTQIQWQCNESLEGLD